MFRKTAILSVLVGAYPLETKTSGGNFKNAATLRRQNYIANIVVPIPLHAQIFLEFRACALVLPLCRHRGNEIIFEHENIKEMLAVQTIEPLKNLSNHIQKNFHIASVVLIYHLRGEGGLIDLIFSIRLCNILMISYLQLAVHFMPPFILCFILCWGRLIPPPFPLKTM